MQALYKITELNHPNNDISWVGQQHLHVGVKYPVQHFHMILSIVFSIVFLMIFKKPHPDRLGSALKSEQQMHENEIKALGQLANGQVKAQTGVKLEYRHSGSV